MLLAIHLLMIGVFILFGMVFAFGKGAGLIAGLAWEKAEYDEKKLCKAMSKTMFILAGCWLLIASSEIFKTVILLWIGLFCFFTVCAAAVLYINTGCKK